MQEWQAVTEWLRNNWATLANAMAALATAIFTAVLVYYNRGLLQATRTSADAAHLSAEAAKTMADIAQQTHRSNQEAVVQCFGADFQPRVRHGALVGPEHRVRLSFKNVASGFAKRFEARAHIQVASHGTPEVGSAAPYLLAPGEFAFLSLGTLSEAQLMAIRDGLRANILGSLSYESLGEQVNRTFVLIYDPQTQHFSKLEALPPVDKTTTR